MNELSAINSKAIGFTSIGNPINLILQLDRLSKIAGGYTLYVCLNIGQHICGTDRYKILVDNCYKIIKSYEAKFKKIKILDLTLGQFLTHGACIDQILHCFEEDAIAIFEEDAYIFDSNFFDEKFKQLNTHHIVMGMNRGEPNNKQFFAMISSLATKEIRPGKESFFFLRKDLLHEFNWASFDYLTLEKGMQLRLPYTDLCATIEDWVGFDTSEFLSVCCTFHPKIKMSFYTEETYAYWPYFGENKFDEFYTHYSSAMPYCHYFNSIVYYNLNYHNESNHTDMKEMSLKIPNPDIFLSHMSTHILQLAMLRVCKQKYVAVIGIDEYNYHKKSLKHVLGYLFNYFGLWYVRHRMKMYTFLKFTHKFVQNQHGPVL